MQEQIEVFDPLQPVDTTFDPLVAPVKRKLKPKVELEKMKEPLLQLHQHLEISMDGIPYLNELINRHQMWAHAIYPGMRYEDFCMDMDKLSTSKDFKQWHHEQIREEMGILTNQYEDDDIVEDIQQVEIQVQQVDIKEDYLVHHSDDNMDVDVDTIHKQHTIHSDDDIKEVIEDINENEEVVMRQKRKNAMELLRKRRMEE